MSIVPPFFELVGGPYDGQTGLTTQTCKEIRLPYFEFDNSNPDMPTRSVKEAVYRPSLDITERRRIFKFSNYTDRRPL